jgi:HAD superfamily hydrolase (TIGR01458 family)
MDQRPRGEILKIRRFAPKMKAILLDLDGVLYQGESALAGASEALDWMRRRGILHLFLTNTTSRPREAIRKKLAGMGITIASDEIVTPPVAARDWLIGQGVSRVSLFVPKATRGDFEGLNILPEQVQRGCQAVVVGDLGEGWDFPTLNRAFRLLMDEPRPRLIALGMTRYWHAADGLRLDTAPFVVALQHATGIAPAVLGKPARPFFEAALDKLGAKADETLMIGDDIRGDIGGAQAAGIHGLLVRTGKFRPGDLEGEIHPDGVMDSIADLPDWWTGNVP